MAEGRKTIWLSLWPTVFLSSKSALIATCNCLEPLASGEARVEVVPEFDVRLVLFPAEKDFLAADDGREIHQSALQILDENPPALEFGEHSLHVRQRANPVVDCLAADVTPLLRQAAQALVKTLQVPAQAVQPLQPPADLRQQRARLLAGVMFGVLPGHGLSEDDG